MSAGSRATPAPGERVIRPWLTTSLFPGLPRRSRTAFRVGLLVVAVAAAGCALLRWPVPVVATAVLGLPVLFAVYLREIGVRRAVAARLLALLTCLAVGVGMAWAFVAGPVVTEAYNDALGGRMDIPHLLLCGAAIPATYAFVLVAPAAASRVVDRPSRPLIDGFALGAWGALAANAAATATLLAPQLAMGLDADSQSSGTLLAEAIVEGVAWPLGSVAVGGVFGMALWFAPSADAAPRHRSSVVVPAALLGAVVFSTAMGVLDVAPLTVGPYIALELAMAALAVLALRMVIADAVSHEAAGDTGRPPLRGGDSVQRAGAHDYVRVLRPLAGGLGAAVAVAMGVAVLIKPPPPAYSCPPDCGRPPIGDPVETNPRFSGDDGAFSVAYPGEGTAYEVTFDPPGMNGVQLAYTGGDTGMLRLFGEQAADRTANQITHDVLHSRYPGATVAYEIPNAAVGYEPGYGVVADLYRRDASSTYTRVRIIVMAAVRHDYALIATAAGPYHEFSPDYGTGHPSGANLEVAMDMAKYVNSFRWNGDRYVRSP